MERGGGEAGGLQAACLPPLAATQCLALPGPALGSTGLVSLVAFEVVSDPLGEQSTLSPFVLERPQGSFQDQRFKQGV